MCIIYEHEEVYIAIQDLEDIIFIHNDVYETNIQNIVSELYNKNVKINRIRYNRETGKLEFNLNTPNVILPAYYNKEIKENNENN